MKTKKNRELQRARNAPVVGNLFAEASQAYSAGDFETAERHATRLLRDQPRNADALNLIGVIAAGRSDMPRAAKFLSQAAELQPRTASIRGNLALALKMLGRWHDAIAQAREGVRLDPSNAIIWNTLCAAQFELGDYDSASVSGRIAIALDPVAAEAWNNFGNVLVEVGHPLAESAFRAALARHPRLVQAWSGLGSAALRQRRYESALPAFEHALTLRWPSRWWPGGSPSSSLPPAQSLTNTVKLRHDIEQFEAGRRAGIYGPEFDAIISAYRRALDRFISRYGATANGALHPDDVATIGDVYGRIVHWSPPPAIPGGAIASGWDRGEVSKRYAVPPGICWVDGLLTDEALTSLRRFCLDSTIWNDVSHNYQAEPVARGYLGAYAADGFFTPLLFQIADELAAALPEIFDGHSLRQIWAYKYEEKLEGIGIHGDDAAVNVNFWITPDSANLDPDSGGLLVYPVEAPAHWDFAAINTHPDAMLRFVESAGKPAVNVPYRQNRAVIFNSDLFHATAPLRFRPGYDNRRINVTMLFGRRQAHGRSAQ